jgi:hypothetical protein
VANHKIAIIQASLGGIDKNFEHVPQTIPYDHFFFTDENFPPRKVMSPRLQAKIPKFFAWQLKPDYEYYLWLDGNIRLNHPEALKYFLDHIQGYDFVVLRHPTRPNIRQEVRYTRKGINQQSIYMLSRYTGEYLKEQYEAIQADKEFVVDLLVNGGIFMYRNTPQVHQMFKEWWYNVTRYIVQDQIAFPYVLKKSGIKLRVLNHKYDEWEYLKHIKHKKRNV